jgi:renal tumor antigen
VIPFAKGGYGRVDLYKKRTTGDIFAVKTVNIKSMKDKKLYSTLKTETQILNEINSDYIVNCYYIIKEKSNIYYVMEYMKGGDLFSLLSSVYLLKSTIQLITAEVLLSLFYLHSKNITHRDIKPENILIKGDNSIKLADLGSCKGIYLKHPFTEYISTRWYRAPECLLTDGYYNYKMDIWGLGCVFYEILTFCPLFPGADEIDQVNKIHGILGSPSKELFMQLINKTQRTEIVYEKRKGINC